MTVPLYDRAEMMPRRSAPPTSLIELPRAVPVLVSMMSAPPSLFEPWLPAKAAKTSPLEASPPSVEVTFMRPPSSPPSDPSPGAFPDPPSPFA